MREVKNWETSLIIYESPHRVKGCLRDLAEVLGGDRQAAVCRELTKKFEEISRASLADLVVAFADREVKGEVVIVIDRAAAAAINSADVEHALAAALQVHSVKEASQIVAEKFGMSKRDAYQMALRLGEGTEAELVTYCHSGQRSELAAEILRAAGYDAANYRGSWHEWSRDASLPVENG